MVHLLKGKIRSLISWLLCVHYKIPTNCIIYPSAKLRNVTCEGRNKIYKNARLYDSSLGYGTYVGQNSNIINCKIGKYSLVGFEAMIGAHPLKTVATVHPALYSTRGQYGFTYVEEDYFEEYTYAEIEGNRKWSITIGNDVWITAGSTKIVQNVKIGDGAVVLLDAVVTKDVPPYAIVGGVPAKVVGYRFSPEQIEFLLKLKWWDRGEEWIKEHAKYFYDIKILMEKVREEEKDFDNIDGFVEAVGKM